MKKLTFFQFYVLSFTLFLSLTLGIRIPFQRVELDNPIAHVIAKRKHGNNHHHQDDSSSHISKSKDDYSYSSKLSSTIPIPSPALPSSSSTPPSSNSDARKTTVNFVANGASIGGNIGDYFDIRYSANFTLNGKKLVMALDTGCADAWVLAPPELLGQFVDSGLEANISYGDSSYGIDGTISYASLEFGQYKVESQAFINVSHSTVSGITDIGMNGLFGLGFGGAIDDKIKEAYGQNVTWGQSFLPNLFSQNITLAAFFTIQLSRTDDLESTYGGSLEISTIDPHYEAVQGAPKLYQYPPSPSNNKAWTTLLDGMQLDGKDVPLHSSFDDSPPGKAVALLDTGMPGLWMSKDILDSVYQVIPGSAYCNATQQWLVPCNTTSILSFSLGGQIFPIHPLDLSTLNLRNVNGKNYTVCNGAFLPYNMSKAPGYFDIGLGDSFLRNTVTLFSYGDRRPGGALGEPYMQLLSVTDPTNASTDAVASRKMNLEHWPEQISPVSAAALS